METPLAANQRRGLNFGADQRTDGCSFRIPEDYGDCLRECLALVAGASTGRRRFARRLATRPGLLPPRLRGSERV